MEKEMMQRSIIKTSIIIFIYRQIIVESASTISFEVNTTQFDSTKDFKTNSVDGDKTSISTAKQVTTWMSKKYSNERIGGTLYHFGRVKKEVATTHVDLSPFIVTFSENLAEAKKETETSSWSRGFDEHKSDNCLNCETKSSSKESRTPSESPPENSCINCDKTIYENEFTSTSNLHIRQVMVISKDDPSGSYYHHLDSTDGSSYTSNLDIITQVSNLSRNYLKSSDDLRIIDTIQVTCTLIGTITNLLTSITLFSHHRGFSRIILALLRHQALIDFAVCIMASTLILQPFHWMTGFYYVDVVVCYTWHSQALYWGGVTASTYNLILVAYERYLAVCRPFRHSDVSSWSKKNFAKVFVGLYILTLLITHGAYIQTKLVKDVCENKYAFDGPGIDEYFVAFVIFTYLTTYLIPAILMGLCYGLVIRQLRRRALDTNLGRSTRLERASDQLTRTAVAVTVVFICTVGYDLHYYLLGYTGVVAYQLDTQVQKIGVFLSNVNSSVTPFVYAATMPIFRRRVVRTLCCLFGKRNFEDRSVSSRRSANSADTSMMEDHSVVARKSNNITQSTESSISLTTTVSHRSIEVSVIEVTG